MFELIYTSYPKGLHGGTSGFTSVAYTEGIPKYYIQLCESLSGYLFLYPVGHHMYELNPEIYTHYRFRFDVHNGHNIDGYNVNGTSILLKDNFRSSVQQISVLSRISASGRDYTGRENKIAHHIIIDADEQRHCIEGPAWVMMYEDLFMDKWSQEPCFLPQRSIGDRGRSTADRLLSQGSARVWDRGGKESHASSANMEPSVLGKNHWQTIFGDHGDQCGADILSKSSQTYPETPSFILFDPVEHRGLCLPLALEALKMVTPEKRWDITFNTYFLSKHMDSDCLWRFCPVNYKPANKTDTFTSYSFGDDATLTKPYSHTAVRPNHTDALPKSSFDHTAAMETELADPSFDYMEKYPESLVIDLIRKRILGKIPSSKEPPISSQSSLLVDSPKRTSSLMEEGSCLPEKEEGDISRPNVSKNLSLWIILSFVIIGASLLFVFFSDYIPGIGKNFMTNSTHALKENLDKEKLVKKKPYKEQSDEIQVDETQPVKKQSEEAQTDEALSGKDKADRALSVKALQEKGPLDAAVFGAVTKNIDKKMAVSFYGDIEQIISDNYDLENMRCRIIKNDGMEVDVSIEKPITNDTPDWSIVPRGSGRFLQPIGNISMNTLSLYDKALYSGIYIDVPSRKNTDFIWINPVKMTPSMISQGIEPYTLEIRLKPEMSDLLTGFLRLLSSENLECVVELQQNGDSLTQLDKKSGDLIENSEHPDLVENQEHPDSNLKQTSENISANNTILNPIVLIGANNNGHMQTDFISLKFTEDEFNSVMKSISLMKNLSYEKDSPFKEFKIDYAHSLNSKRYPVLCFPCKYH
ncbi:MAG: hypothetical protein HQK62_08950 [Desulfamplus sp.]|nr:hypothetical protein [Desulfamplus sp.]